jgi:hypothetical protein
LAKKYPFAILNSVSLLLVGDDTAHLKDCKLAEIILHHVN